SFLAMFPQLVAGPIIRAKDLLKQLKTYRIPNDLEKWNAVKMICYGLFQKVVISDNLASVVDAAYEGKAMYADTGFWWFVAIAFSFQIYADFSGYSLIARGLAKLMGYHFRINFNHPYLATGLRQFWNRWHISLSTWFRDYVYIPIGGSRNGVWVGALALIVTMVLSGIWHGANYTFIVWALLHATYLLAERHLKWTKRLKKFRLLLIFITFIQVCVAWVYFRADTIPQANDVIGSMFSFNFSNLGFTKTYFNETVFLVLALVVEGLIYIRKQHSAWRRFYKKHQSPIDITMLAFSIICIIFLRGEGHQFIYFQF
ncbi:MAG: MBOAT family O-acyltransferase, partial [Flavobacteriales bacterium]